MTSQIQTWSYYLPEDSGVYFWQEWPDTDPILVLWNSETCIALSFDGLDYYPENGRWFQPTHPDPNSPWDRPQITVTNSTKEPIEVRIKSDYVDRHPEILEGLEGEDEDVQ